MIKPTIVAGIATGKAPTYIAADIMATACPLCTAEAVFRGMAGAPTKRAALRKALVRAGLKGHACNA